MDRQTDRWRDGGMDRRTDGGRDGQTDGQVEGRTDGRTDGGGEARRPRSARSPSCAAPRPNELYGFPPAPNGSRPARLLPSGRSAGCGEEGGRGPKPKLHRRDESGSEPSAGSGPRGGQGRAGKPRPSSARGKAGPGGAPRAGAGSREAAGSRGAPRLHAARRRNGGGGSMAAPSDRGRRHTAPRTDPRARTARFPLARPQAPPR